jgi:transcriptional regulator with XRE-family HTH domain
MQRPPIPEAAIRRRLSINIKARRVLEGLTVKRAAMLARLPTGTWKKLEAGEAGASQQTLERVAEALDTTPEKLLRAPHRNCVASTAAEIEGFRISEMLPEEMQAALLEPLAWLAEQWGIPLEDLADMAEALDLDPLDLLAKIRPSRAQPMVRH